MTGHAGAAGGASTESVVGWNEDERPFDRYTVARRSIARSHIKRMMALPG